MRMTLGRTGRLVMSLAAFVVLALGATVAQAEEVFRGIVFEAETGLVLGTDDDMVFVLEGRDMSRYVDAYVLVGGNVRVEEDGTQVLDVTRVEFEPETPVQNDDAPYFDELQPPAVEANPQ
ncbi:hypothetical protein GGQ74_001972 [Desulfobaculum xiamenense]|uniref:Uncharacterized protein n=1 Tax=Desulfobaculum xiamenense TaxID=995050 RepID=A0A846QUI0_9BACT|nr:DUF5818 domain-containing protein [Desulfobaculum xiamenense]NJB68299.1 hypothetical protein [Desulfobaculum xiamenense]